MTGTIITTIGHNIINLGTIRVTIAGHHTVRHSVAITTIVIGSLLLPQALLFGYPL